MSITTRIRSRLLATALVVLVTCNGSLLLGQELRAAIYVMKRDGSAPRKVAQIKGYKELSMPVWSHDGTRLAFDALEVASGTKKLFVVNVDGGDLKKIGEAETPDWSPDDKQIACHFRGGLNMPEGVYVQNLDGKGRVRIAAGVGPRWSPDGGRLACTDGRNLNVLDLVTGEERGLIVEPVDQVMPGFDWSPDGKRLAVVVMRDRKKELWIVAAELNPSQAKSRLKVNLDPRVSWSADGKRIVFSANRRLSTLDPDGKGTAGLPNQHGDSVEPTWSPDGQWLAFAGNHPPQPGDAEPQAAK
jgi:dipeptidyl aminopeptidase/acylaminoacyl peptidase